MFVKILLLIIGFILLIKGADIFVDGASSTATNFKISKVLIGLTIVAFGTSSPELAVSMNALSQGSADLVIGNVIGSNITNILLILGLSVIIKELVVKKNTIKKELPLHMLITAILVVLFLDNINGLTPNMISRTDAFVILLTFSVFLHYLFSISRNKIDEDSEPPKYSLLKSIIFVALGLLAIIIGSDLVVESATAIAHILGVSERIISLTIITFGTSLPELVTAIVSTLKGEHDILVGNIIGSNIFNICIVLGLPVAIYGNLIPSNFEIIDLITIMLTSIILYIIPKINNYKISRSFGIILVLLYVTYYALVFVV